MPPLQSDGENLRTAPISPWFTVKVDPTTWQHQKVFSFAFSAPEWEARPASFPSSNQSLGRSFLIVPNASWFFRTWTWIRREFGVRRSKENENSTVTVSQVSKKLEMFDPYMCLIFSRAIEVADEQRELPGRVKPPCCQANPSERNTIPAVVRSGAWALGRHWADATKRTRRYKKPSVTHLALEEKWFCGKQMSMYLSQTCVFWKILCSIREPSLLLDYRT